jgi:flagellar P-ring protein precursor FlgI
MRFSALTAAVLVVCSTICSSVRATTVKELVRIKGQGESVLQGYGLVTGLAGTGDSGKELAMARPLAKVLESQGNALGTPKDLANSKAVALVMVTCTVPAAGVRADDTLDVSVTVLNSASSLKGGELFLAPLKGPIPDPKQKVWAIAQGLVDLQDPTVPTVGKVRGGARIIDDILMPGVGDTFDLIIDQPFAGWAAASQIAVAINAKAQPQGPRVATAIDERTVRVTVPEPDRMDRAGFLADVLAADVNVQLLDIPAQVICNQRTGSIIITGDVEISPVAITQKDLTITTTIPAPVASAQNPLVQRDRWTQLTSGARPSEMAKLADLVKAFKQLDIPVENQIGIIQMLHKTGKLQAKLVID